MPEQIKTTNNSEEISLKELIQKIQEWFNYLLSKWIFIVLFGLGGAAIGLAVAIFSKPKYTAHLSFALVEKSSGGGGLADLASSFGFAGLMGGGGSGTFSGDNLLEIMKSRYSIEQTLLAPVNYKGKNQNLVEVYIEINELRGNWEKQTKNIELQKLSFPVDQKRELFTRTQDSVLFSIYNEIVTTNQLTVARKDKKISLVNLNFTSRDEVFSKLFVEKLMSETYQFYSETRTAQSRSNIRMMEMKADSIKRLYESALYKGASISQVNINPALQIAAVPRVKQENNAQLYATVYGEVLKNLETLKLDMARETPIVQIVDSPRLPLKVEKLGKVKAILIGGILGGLLIVMYLLGALFFKNALQDK